MEEFTARLNEIETSLDREARQGSDWSNIRSHAVSDEGNDDSILEAMARTNPAAYQSIVAERQQNVCDLVFFVKVTFSNKKDRTILIACGEKSTRCALAWYK